MSMTILTLKCKSKKFFSTKTKHYVYVLTSHKTHKITFYFALMFNV